MLLTSCLQNLPNGRTEDWIMFGHDPQHTRQSRYLGPRTNHLKWKSKTGNWFYSNWSFSSSPALGSNGNLHIGTYDGKLYSNFEYSTGYHLTKCILYCPFIAEGSIYSSPAIAPDLTVYFGCGDKKLYALNSSKRLKWTFTTNGDITYSSPNIGKDGTVYIGCLDKKL